MLVNLGREEALARMERLRQRVAAHVFFLEGQQVPITVSIGVTWLDGCGAGFGELLRSADAALYCAKEGGRNRVETSERAAGCRKHPRPSGGPGSGRCSTGW